MSKRSFISKPYISIIKKRSAVAAYDQVSQLDVVLDITRLTCISSSTSSLFLFFDFMCTGAENSDSRRYVESNGTSARYPGTDNLKCDCRTAHQS